MRVISRGSQSESVALGIFAISVNIKVFRAVFAVVVRLVLLLSSKWPRSFLPGVWCMPNILRFQFPGFQWPGLLCGYCGPVMPGFFLVLQTLNLLLPSTHPRSLLIATDCFSLDDDLALI